MIENLREAVRRHLVPRRHSALLVAIITALVARPLIGDVGVGPLVFSLALLVVLLVALVTIQVDELMGERETLLVQRRRRSFVGWALAVPAVGERLYVMFAPSHRLYLIGSVSWLLFFAFVTWSQLRTLLKHREVTGETISMSVSVYLLLGLTWGVLYIALFEYQPQAFNFGGSVPAGAELQQHIFPVLIYFSLTTLSTVGFGDITPVTLQARYAAVAESIAGQFYLAILVARLVSMHMSRPVDSSPREQQHTGTS